MKFVGKGKQIGMLNLVPNTALNFINEHVREQWTSKLDFLLSCLGFAVGLGNVWRFPYLAYSNGGGAFFIPYFTMLIFVGIPIFLMESVIGQFSSSGPTTCWDFCRLIEGCGYAMIFVTFLTCIFYNMIIAWSFFYIFISLTPEVPWYHCGDWSTPYCSERVRYITLEGCKNESGSPLPNGLCNSKESNGSVWLWNTTLAQANGIYVNFPAKEYFERRVLGATEGYDISNIGPMRLDLVACLILAWLLVLLCLAKGIKITGKIVYITSTMPYLMLFILLFRGLYLDGALEGIMYYISPNITAIKSPRIWKDAAVQIFFSLSSSYGGLITLSSYNKFHNDILSDSIFVCIGNSLTSIFAGFVVFSFLGFLARDLNTPISNVAASGPALAFHIYPFCLTKLPGTSFWSVVFFITIILLGIDSQFVLTETVITGIVDLHPELRRRKSTCCTVICFIMFLLGLPLTCNGGMEVLKLLDANSSGWNVLLIAFCECIAVNVYGVSRFIKDLQLMIGVKFCRCLRFNSCCQMWWKINWAIITPALVTFVIVFSASDQQIPKGYPLLVEIIAWCMMVAAFSLISLKALWNIWHEQGTLKQRMLSVLRPSVWWGPALREHRQLVLQYIPDFVVDPEAIPMPEESKLSEDTASLSVKKTSDEEELNNETEI